MRRARRYAAADVFVLPSRGEGWGRPHVEAMAMGLPVIATNWSGPTAFMTPANSYPLRVEALEEIAGGAFAGHRYASPSVAHLRELMRASLSDAGRAERGARARRDMLEFYSPGRLARFVALQLARIDAVVRARAAGGAEEL